MVGVIAYRPAARCRSPIFCVFFSRKLAPTTRQWRIAVRHSRRNNYAARKPRAPSVVAALVPPREKNKYIYIPGLSDPRRHLRQPPLCRGGTSIDVCAGDGV